MSNADFKTRSRRVRNIWIVVILLAAAAAAWGMWPRPTEEDLVTIDSGDVRVELVDEGRTRMHDVYIVSAPVSGRVLRVDVEPGDTVAKGTIIARMTQAAAGFLDTRSDLSARATVDAAAASLRAADTDLVLASREHERMRTLATQKLVATAAVDISQAKLDSAQAARDAAKAGLARAQSALQPAERMAGGNIVIRAPVAGSVLRVPQKSENVVPVGSPLIEIGDRGHVEVVAEFLSQDAVRMRAGQKATIENWGGAPLAATVDRIEPVARLKISALGVEEQRTNVVLQFLDPAAASALGHEFRVDVRVAVEEAGNVLRAPLGALFRHDAGWAVYKVVDGRARLTDVTIGIADTSYRQITGGLAVGDQVVLFPGSTIKDGQRVTQRRTH
ncbi:MAG: efflux RND transporter periplasmic adaptor subunit [Steroidobacteraceae bacterium]